MPGLVCLLLLNSIPRRANIFFYPSNQQTVKMSGRAALCALILRMFYSLKFTFRLLQENPGRSLFASVADPSTTSCWLDRSRYLGQLPVSLNLHEVFVLREDRSVIRSTFFHLRPSTHATLHSVKNNTITQQRKI